MKQIIGNVQILLYLLGTFVLAIFFFSLAVGIHQDQVRGAAQVPRYKADCSGALWYSGTTPDTPCFDVQTYLVLTNHRSKSFDHYTAELTLPNGKEVIGSVADGTPSRLMSGSYTAEIWHGKLTQILVKNQVLRTYDNPVVQGQGDSGVFIAMLVVGGIVFLFFSSFCLLALVKSVQGSQ